MTAGRYSQCAGASDPRPADGNVLQKKIPQRANHLIYTYFPSQTGPLLAAATAAVMGAGQGAPTGMNEEEDRAEARSEVREEMNEAEAQAEGSDDPETFRR